MKRISLCGEWALRGRREDDAASEMLTLTAKVPGCVQLDMSREGLLPADLLVGANIVETEKYEDYEWWYERSFEAPKERRGVFLVFRGVDCLAEYFLNGVKFGESDNMFIAHEFEVGALLCEGENRLTVHIKSPVKYAHEQDYDLYNLARAGRDTPINTAIRRAPHTYGWDIMPRAVTSGLWREVFLEVRDSLYFSQTFFDFSGDHRQFCYTIEGAFSDFSNVEIEIEAHCGDSRLSLRRAVKYKAGRLHFHIENPKLWWPLGYGEPNVYDAVLRIYKDGAPVHETSTSFGIRTVALEYSDQTDGTHGYFRFRINGQEIMCKGTNWVPLDAFHCRDAERYERALSLARECNCNILRCWGGSVYEDHPFFDFCDRNGIMVWQDFAMACNNYPQREEFFDKMRREATAVVREYRGHPSLVLWCGDNENDRYADWERSLPSLNRITREVLPRVVSVNDVGRPYIPSSPYISDKVFYDHTLGPAEQHLWSCRYYKDDFYKHTTAHYISEIGYYAFPALETVRTFITTKEIWPYPNNREWSLHSSDQNGSVGRIRSTLYQLRQVFGEEPKCFEDIITASQITQAEAYKYFIEMCRTHRPRKSGIIWWNLLDGWPQTSDATVDYYFRKKISFGYVKRSQEPFLFAFDELTEGRLCLYACNDTLQRVSGHVSVVDAESDEELFSGEFSVPENASTKVATLVSVEYWQKRLLLIRWMANGQEGFNHYLAGYPPFDFKWYSHLMQKYLL